MNINDNYPELFSLKDKSYGTYEIDKPVVIFMDGVGVTRNHHLYNMLQPNNYTVRLSQSANALLRMLNIDCTYYAALDEISFIFPDTQQLIDVMRMDNTKAYIESLFAQKFVKIMWNYYPQTIIKVTSFNIGSENIQEWIKYRTDVCKNNSVMYVAKEYLDKEKYHEKESKEIIRELKKEHLYDEVLLKNKALYKGILKTVHRNDDSMINLFANFL